MHRRTLLRCRPAPGPRAAASLSTLCFGHRAACALPHPKKAYRGGEDAFVLHRSALGVADGVGGYARHGIDPGRYTRFLMESVLQQLRREEEEEEEELQQQQQKQGGHACDEQSHATRAPTRHHQQQQQQNKKSRALRLLEEAYEATQRRGQPGGCPVTLAAFEPTREPEGRKTECVADAPQLSVCHLGDCGLLQVRQGKLLFFTEPQQHEFNCPFQLPDDRPSAGRQYTLPVEAGDVFLCASDGVWDNIEFDELVRLLSGVGQDSCETVAQQIGALAARNAQDAHFCSPFARHAAEAGYQYSGGKLDDITALVARTTRNNDEDDDEQVSARAKGQQCPALITELLGLPPCPP